MIKNHLLSFILIFSILLPLSSCTQSSTLNSSSAISIPGSWITVSEHLAELQNSAEKGRNLEQSNSANENSINSNSTSMTSALSVSSKTSVTSVSLKPKTSSSIKASSTPTVSVTLPVILEDVPVINIPEDLYNLTISGKSKVTAEQMVTYLIKTAYDKYKEYPKVNDSLWELVNFYLTEGNVENVRGDIAFVQAIHETKFFLYGRDVKWDQNNYAGIGATGGVPGHSFDTPQIGIRAQIQHLKAYGTSNALVNAVVDPRYHYVTPKGKAPKWTDLSGIWAVPGYSKDEYASLEEAMSVHCDYGSTILKYYNDIKNTKPDSALVARSKKVGG